MPVAAGIFISAVLLAWQPDSPSVTIAPDPARQETVYRILSRGCDISWTVPHTKVNAGIVQQRSQCVLPLADQLDLAGKLLERILKDQPARFDTLFLGRLDLQPGMSERLARLAKESPQWDVRAGRAKSGPDDSLVVGLANDTALFADWQQLFHRFGLRIRVSGVENVAVSPAGSLPFFDDLQKHGVRAADRLPHDCLIWFGVTKEEL